jgi:hypothetical protein
MFQWWDYILSEGSKCKEHYNQNQQLWNKNSEENQEEAIRSFFTAPMNLAQYPCQHHRYRGRTTWSNVAVKRLDGEDEDPVQWH